MPDDALYYAAQGCIEVGLRDSPTVGTYLGTSKLQWWIDEGQHEEKKKLGSAGLWKEEAELKDHFWRVTRPPAAMGVFRWRRRQRATEWKRQRQGQEKELAARPQGKITRRPKVRLPMLGKTDKLGPVVVGCDFGSTTAKAVCMSPDKELLFSCYALSRGNPIDDAKSLFRQVQRSGWRRRNSWPGHHGLRQGFAERYSGRGLSGSRNHRSRQCRPALFS